MPKRKLTIQKVDAVEPESFASGNSPEHEVVSKSSAATPIKSAQPSPSKKRKVLIKEEEVQLSKLPRGAKPGRKAKVEETLTVEVKEESLVANGDSQDKTKRKGKSKDEKLKEVMPLAVRTAGHKLFIGAHVSGAGGVHNSVGNSVHIGANAFALFLKSQRKWANPPLMDDHCSAFHGNCKQHSYDQGKHVVPHGSYLVNMACTDKARSEQAYESYLDDLKRCEKLGIGLYNIHPGNTLSNERPAAIAHLAMQINKAHKATNTVVTLLENMAAGGNVLGSTFEDLRDIIALVENKDRIGVCIDTCHSFAAGYDLRSPEAFKSTMDDFENIVGFKYLRALHLNDSKAPFESHRDLHANIGTGFLGLRAFHNIVNDVRFEGLPLVLETPIDAKDEAGTLLKDEKGKDKEDKGIWAREIKMLESLVGMEPDSEEFLRLEEQLAKQGEPERKKLADQFKRKQEKGEKKAKSPRKPKSKKAKPPTDDESSLSELEEEP